MDKWIKVKQINWDNIQREQAIKSWGSSCLDDPRTLELARRPGLVPSLVRKSHKELSPEPIELVEQLELEGS